MTWTQRVDLQNPRRPESRSTSTTACFNNQRIEHHEAATSGDAVIGEYIRLFMLPGVLHCGGGPGPGQADWVELVRDGIENGNPSERVVLSKEAEGEVIMTRPVLPYPRVAVWRDSFPKLWKFRKAVCRLFF
jgi:hypothetical protein